MGSDHHAFGGDWTAVKLAVLARYLAAYATALKKQPFAKLYIDAFAGSGYRSAHDRRATSGREGLLFPDLVEAEPQDLLDRVQQ